MLFFRNTRAMCEHIVKVENATKTNKTVTRDRHGISNQKEEKNNARSERLRSGAKTGSTTTATTAKTPTRRRGTSNSIHDPAECRVQLFERNEFQVCTG